MCFLTSNLASGFFGYLSERRVREGYLNSSSRSLILVSALRRFSSNSRRSWNFLSSSALSSCRLANSLLNRASNLDNREFNREWFIMWQSYSLTLLSLSGVLLSGPGSPALFMLDTEGSSASVHTLVLSWTHDLNKKSLVIRCLNKLVFSSC